uniref:Uncharacterized protein n=1 Tax=Arion vulgaris TaxID=1028688 RepID=A0A0B6ZG25_9EUPU
MITNFHRLHSVPTIHLHQHNSLNTIYRFAKTQQRHSSVPIDLLTVETTNVFFLSCYQT